MTREAQKAAYELKVFASFLERSGLCVDRASIRNGDAITKEPDVICRYSTGAEVGFELGRLIDPNLAKVMNQREPENGQYIRTADPSAGIARSKLQKRYGVAFPVELLLYTENPIITPDDVIIPTITPICREKHHYSKVWFMGDDVCLLYERGRYTQ